MLKCIGYVNHHGTVQIKGKVACQLHSHEVLLTELLFQNVFDDFQSPEIVALLSSLVFQQVIPVYSMTAKAGFTKCKSHYYASRLAVVELCTTVNLRGVVTL